jgi:hypothetical protein
MYGGRLGVAPVIQQISVAIGHVPFFCALDVEHTVLHTPSLPSDEQATTELLVAVATAKMHKLVSA